MDANIKDTFDSLNNDINLYKDGLEIVEGMLELYRSFFCLTDKEGNSRNFIIDYGVNIIEKYKKQWIDLFENAMIFRNIKSLPEIQEIKVENFNYIFYSMEKFFLKEYGLFLNSWNLEIATFVERNSNVKNINVYIIEQSKDDIRKFNLKFIKQIIEEVKSEAYLEMDNLVKALGKSISIEHDDLKYFIANKSSMDLNTFYDEVNLMRESVFMKIDEFQEKVKVIIEEKLVKETLNKINQATEEKLGLIIKNYIETLNKYYILTMDMEKKTTMCRCRNSLITNESLYRRCISVLEGELTYICFVKSIYIEGFRSFEQETQGRFNDVFNHEFYSSIYDIRFPSDFENLIEAYEVKTSFILNSLVTEIIKSFIYKCEEIILFMVKNRKERIEKLYVFKPITYMGNFNIYEPSVMLQLHRGLNDIYLNYDLKLNESKELKAVKKAYLGLKEEVYDIVKTFNYKNIEVESLLDVTVEEENNIIHSNVTFLKDEAWKLLNSRLINIFNSFNSMIERSIKQLELEINLYKSRIDYIDY
ncbi:hypothetical protein [Clostridium culturomicium]|uniref:hypothetical protein n=1 Tax=Clostridium culturomicium TaxID=1499683 RepID=UPI00058F9D81|nr:hypothetical protein [Clostridium culturomicium]